MTEDFQQRLGSFHISSYMITDNPDYIAREVFRDMIVIRCEHLFAQSGFDYTAMADRFDPVPAWIIPPRYDLGFIMADGVLSHEWRKVEE